MAVDEPVLAFRIRYADDSALEIYDAVEITWDLASPTGDYMAMIVYREGEILRVTGISPEMLGAS